MSGFESRETEVRSQKNPPVSVESRKSLNALKASKGLFQVERAPVSRGNRRLFNHIQRIQPLSTREVWSAKKDGTHTLAGKIIVDFTASFMQTGRFSHLYLTN